MRAVIEMIERIYNRIKDKMYIEKEHSKGDRHYAEMLNYELRNSIDDASVEMGTLKRNFEYKIGVAKAARIEDKFLLEKSSESLLKIDKMVKKLDKAAIKKEKRYSKFRDMYNAYRLLYEAEKLKDTIQGYITQLNRYVDNKDYK